MKIDISNLRVHADARFARSGSILGGNITGGADAIRLEVSLDSDAPADRVREVIRLGEASCFTAGALRQVVPVELAATVNGESMQISVNENDEGGRTG